MQSNKNITVLSFNQNFLNPKFSNYPSNFTTGGTKTLSTGLLTNIYHIQVLQYFL